jgi:Fur family transcriptional regulator, peroxide stress response regulator
MKRSPKELDARVGEMVERCRSAGMNLTPQRVVIYRALLESEDHPSPEALRDRVKEQLPAVSLATIYKTLDVLVDLGLASEFAATGNTKRYDGNMGPHHHLVCESCGRVEDYEDDRLGKLPLPKGLNGFTPRHLSIHIHGLCSSCRNQTPRKEKKSWPRN